MFNKKRIFYHESARDSYPNVIQQSKSHIPEWYKKIHKWKNNKMFDMERGFQATVKDCSPFLESLTIGYMITLPYDVYVTSVNGKPYIAWKTHSDETPMFRDPADINLVPAGHHPMEFTWRPNCSFIVPKGYCVLLCHPLNRHDLPFTTLAGVIDGGFALPPYGNIPFYIKKDFEGVIPQGTPIAQIIPFRQDNWLSKIKNGLVDEGKKNTQRTTAVFTGWYKKNIWSRKNFD